MTRLLALTFTIGVLGAACGGDNPENSAAVATDDPVTETSSTETTEAAPSWFAERSEVPDCGTDDESTAEYPNMQARRCFKDAFDSNQPAEMTRLQFGDEGESIKAHFRVLGDGRYEIVGEQFPSPADAAVGGDRWVRYDCDRFEFIDEPGGEVDLVPWINYDGECRLVEEVSK
jgi:hypothetical protein